MYWMLYDVPHDLSTLEYEYPSDCFTWRWPDGNLMYISMDLETVVLVFTWEVGVFNRICFAIKPRI